MEKSNNSEEMTAERLQEKVLSLSQGYTFNIVGVPQFINSLTFIQARSDGTGFHAIETDTTEIVGHNEPFKYIWSFIIEPNRGGPNNGVVKAYSTPDGIVPSDTTAATANPHQYDFSLVTEFYPKAFAGL